MPLLLGLPVKVLKEKYGWGTQKRLPDFADALLEVYEEFSKNDQSIEDLMKQVEQDCGIRFQLHLLKYGERLEKQQTDK